MADLVKPLLCAETERMLYRGQLDGGLWGGPAASEG